MSHELRAIASPSGAKPHDHSSSKYQPTPFASCGTFDVLVGNIASDFGAIARTVRVAAPFGRHARRSFALLQTAARFASDAPPVPYASRWQSVQPESVAMGTFVCTPDAQ